MTAVPLEDADKDTLLGDCAFVIRYAIRYRKPVLFAALIVLSALCTLVAISIVYRGVALRFESVELLLISQLPLYWLAMELLSGCTILASANHALLLPNLRRKLVRTSYCAVAFVAIVPAVVLDIAFGHLGGSLLTALSIAMLFGPLAHKRRAFFAYLIMVCIPAIALLYADRQWHLDLPLDAFCWCGLPFLVAYTYRTFSGGYLFAAAQAHAVREQHRIALAKQELAATNSAQIVLENTQLERRTFLGKHFARAFQSACSTRDGARLMLFTLGSDWHWAALTWIIKEASVLILLALAAVFFLVHKDDGVRDVVVWLLPTLFFLPLQIASAHNLKRRVYLHSAEQALFRLTAGAPNKSMFNAVLGKRLLLLGVRNWSIMTIFALISTALIGVHWWTLVSQLAMAFMALPFVVLPLTSYAKSETRPISIVLWFLFGVAVIIGALIIRRLIGTWFALVFPVCCMIISLYAGALRWNAMQQSPIAFPAGRMER